MDHSLWCHLCGFPINNGNLYLVPVECKCADMSSKLTGLLPGPRNSQATDPEGTERVHFWRLELLGGNSGWAQGPEHVCWFQPCWEPKMSTKHFTIETPCERLLKSVGWVAGNKSLNVAPIPHADALSPERLWNPAAVGWICQATRTWLLIFTSVRLFVSAARTTETV